MATAFKYGGYTFEPRGQFKDFGIKADRNEFYNIIRTLHYPNRGKVADGDEPFDYDEFFTAAGKQVDDVFYCHETGEMYVPCSEDLAVFDQKCYGEEVMARCNRRIAERQERERFEKREALKNASFFTPEQNEAYLELYKAIDNLRNMGVDFAFNDGTLFAFRTDLLKDLTDNMAPMQGQEPIELFYECAADVWTAHDGLYANVKD